MLSPKRLTSTQVLSQCAAKSGGTVQPINFSKPRWAGAPKVDADNLLSKFRYASIQGQGQFLTMAQGNLHISKL